MTEPLVRVRDLCKWYPLPRRGLLRPREQLRALDGVSFDVRRGDIAGAAAIVPGIASTDSFATIDSPTQAATRVITTQSSPATAASCPAAAGWVTPP